MGEYNLTVDLIVTRGIFPTGPLHLYWMLNFSFFFKLPHRPEHFITWIMACEMGWFYEFSPVCDLEVIDFYKRLHCCTSSGTN